MAAGRTNAWGQSVTLATATATDGYNGSHYFQFTALGQPKFLAFTLYENENHSGLPISGLWTPTWNKGTSATASSSTLGIHTNTVSVSYDTSTKRVTVTMGGSYTYPTLSGSPINILYGY